MFQAVSPKQWTAWVYLFNLFRAVSPKQWTVRASLHFPKSVIPCFVRKRDVTQSFASLSNFIPRFVGTRNINVHSLLCRNTEYQCSFPALSEHGISSDETSLNFLLKCHSPFCRMTKCQRCHPQCVLVQRCHRSKYLFLQTISLQIQSKFPNITINTVVGQSFSPVKLQYPLAESVPFLQTNLGIPLFLLIQNKSSSSSYIHSYKAFITS